MLGRPSFSIDMPRDISVFVPFMMRSFVLGPEWLFSKYCCGRCGRCAGRVVGRARCSRTGCTSELRGTRYLTAPAQSDSNCALIFAIGAPSETNAPTSRFFVSDVTDMFSEPTCAMPSAMMIFACR